MTRPFNFFRAGGLDQVHFASGADLINLDKLDPKLWVALACPVKGLAFDARTLELIDVEKDGRIRASELVAAATWTGSLIKNPDELLAGKAELPLASLTDTDEGKRLGQAARSMLKTLGKAEATAISVAQTQEAVKAFDAQPFNGDNIVILDAATKDADKALMTDVLACVTPATDRSGKPGVSVELAASFFKAVAAHAAWLDQAKAEALPLGEGTAAAHGALQAVRAKVDDFFARTRLAAFDARALTALNREEKEYLVIGAKDLVATSAEVAALPLAHVEANRALPLRDGVNPAWAARMATFVGSVVTPLLGEQATLTEAQWGQLTGRFAAFEAWQASKAGAMVEKLGPARIKALAQPGAQAGLDALFVLEKEQELTATSMHAVEKLARCYRDLHRLAVNFVSFREFYERKTPAVFQAGTLYLDQRACELCIRVEDAAKHVTMSPLARAFLLYCDCAKPATGEKLSIVAAITAGDSDNLMVGRNGVFVDRDGKDWDATVTKLVDSPISIRQAFWSPYKKLLRFVEEQVAKRAAEEEKESNELLTAHAAEAGKAADTGKVDGAPKKFDIGVVAALGVAVGGITAALGALLGAFFGLGFWMPLGVVGLVLLISGPSMLIAWLKLRQRNIGPLLEANGWAINANARLNVPFGASLTRVAVKPAGSRVDTTDPYAEARRPWKLYLALLVVGSLGVSWYLGKLDHLLPAPVRSVSVLGEMAPAAEVETKPAAAKPAEVNAPEAK
jgi:hypothetical protein